jgi:hypothetical protein
MVVSGNALGFGGKLRLAAVTPLSSFFSLTLHKPRLQYLGFMVKHDHP